MTQTSLAVRARAFAGGLLQRPLDDVRHRTEAEIEAKLLVCRGCRHLQGEVCEAIEGCSARAGHAAPFWKVLVWRQLGCPLGLWDLPPEQLPDAERAQAMPLGGPGTELKAMLAELGIHDWHDCGCSDMAAQMDLWGVAGCEENRPGIVLHLQTKARERGWGDLLAAGWRSVTSGILLRLSLSDLYGSLVDEAIRRATISWETRMGAGGVQG